MKFTLPQTCVSSRVQSKRGTLRADERQTATGTADRSRKSEQKFDGRITMVILYEIVSKIYLWICVFHPMRHEVGM
jgi:hypothetical protein